MAAVAGRKAGRLQVVAKQGLCGGVAWRFRSGMHVPSEVALLEIVARRPCEHIADRQALAANLTRHDVRRHSLRGTVVMGAPGRMDMVVAGVPSVRCGIDP